MEACTNELTLQGQCFHAVDLPVAPSSSGQPQRASAPAWKNKCSNHSVNTNYQGLAYK